MGSFACRTKKGLGVGFRVRAKPLLVNFHHGLDTYYKLLAAIAWRCCALKPDHVRRALMEVFRCLINRENVPA